MNVFGPTAQPHSQMSGRSVPLHHSMVNGTWTVFPSSAKIRHPFLQRNSCLRSTILGTTCGCAAVGPPGPQCKVPIEARGATGRHLVRRGPVPSPNSQRWNTRDRFVGLDATLETTSRAAMVRLSHSVTRPGGRISEDCLPKADPRSQPGYRRMPVNCRRLCQMNAGL